MLFFFATNKKDSGIVSFSNF
ncbi:Photosystem II protein I [Caenorhabditis elegans]|uniref:Photosystem II protein I n=1 Tax=Caenorhabditis elegans TaxID=6239 RepID=A0A2K5ATN3_CAEEL|nr:Photosystem II protein I [Caenorhabditis elegans]SPC47125.2 Photosystem II protein I [Caenorhabditis elegans]|eukprot:NP_001348673.2 Uncharacterized protein CELE_F27D4.12 [Caenorhabditis elegans]